MPLETVMSSETIQRLTALEGSVMMVLRPWRLGTDLRLRALHPGLHSKVLKVHRYLIGIII